MQSKKQRKNKWLRALSCAMALVLCLTMLSACGSPTETEPSAENETINEQPETTYIDAREWGFYNIDEMEGLIFIEGYSVSGSSEDYVYFYSGADYCDVAKFQSGYIFAYRYMRFLHTTKDPLNTNIRGILNSSASYNSSYNVIDNNSLVFKNMYGESAEIFIIQRETSPYRNDFVCFECDLNNTYFSDHEGIMVPISMLDLDRTAEEYQEDNSKYVKVFLKNPA